MTATIRDESTQRARPAGVQCFEIAGEDARDFAQAQFSGDVRALQPGHWQWNAWLDNRGRVRALMHLADPGDGRLLALLRGGDADEVCASLHIYVLRARVTLRPLQGLRRRFGNALPVGDLRVEQGGIVFGYGECSLWLDGTGPADDDPERERAFRLAGIRSGWPSLPAQTPGTLLPSALGLERLGAISFAKGCYPGQEITARLHYRGSHKSGLHRVIAGFKMTVGGPMLPDSPSADVVLDAVASQAGFEALVVLDNNHLNIFNDLSLELNVVESFQP